MPVRATETIRVAPAETIKLQDNSATAELAILPAATAELHHNVGIHFLGDKVAGIDRSWSLNTESGLWIAQLPV